MIPVVGMLALGIVSGAVTYWGLTVAYKWGIIEWLQVHTRGLLNELVRCNFCLSWWPSLALCAAYAVYAGNAWYVLSAMVATYFSSKEL